MPRPEPSLTKSFRGRTFDVVRLRKGSSWHEQSSKRFHHGFPRKKGLWILPVTPFSEGCECHPVNLFLLVQLDAEGGIKGVETVAARPQTGGSFDEMDLPFHYPDILSASKELEAALAPRSRAALLRARAKAAGPALVASDLAMLLGTSASSSVAKEYLERFGLVRSPTVADDGSSFTADGCRLELMTDARDRVKCVFLRPAEQDRLSPDNPATVKRGDIRFLFGFPTFQSCDPTDYDRYDYPDQVINFAYAKGGVIRQITMMTPAAAPRPAQAKASAKPCDAERV